FFFQAEDGIRDKLVTGVQTCALPILRHSASDASTASLTGRLHGKNFMRNEAHQNPTAQSSQELAAVPFQTKVGIFIKLIAFRLEPHMQEMLVTHRAPPFIVAAAFWTA